jgi:hypothetical protein
MTRWTPEQTYAHAVDLLNNQWRIHSEQQRANLYLMTQHYREMNPDVTFCRRCGHILTHPTSVDEGIGAWCKHKEQAA